MSEKVVWEHWEMCIGGEQLQEEYVVQIKDGQFSSEPKMPRYVAAAFQNNMKLKWVEK